MSENNNTPARNKLKVRKFGETPALGKVSRTPGFGRAPGRKKKILRPKHKKKITKVMISWILLLSFVTLSILSVAFVSHYRKKTEKTAADKKQANDTTHLDLVFEEPTESKLPDLSSDEGLKIVKTALANRDPRLFQDFFILEKDDKPDQALEELIRINEAEGEITSTEWLGLKHCNNHILAQVVVYKDSGEVPGNRLVQLKQGSDGKWRIDLGSYLRKSIPEFAKILSGESKTSLVRVFVAKDHFYNGIYSDETVWKAYTLASPDIPNLLYAYTKRGSSQDRALRRIFARNEQLHRATLEISKNPESAARQFEITRVIAENWVIGEKDFDEEF